MKDPQNRDMMIELYRIMEKYETPPEDREQIGGFIDGARMDLTVFYHKWWELGRNGFAMELAHAMYRAVCAQCRPRPDDDTNKTPGTAAGKGGD